MMQGGLALDVFGVGVGFVLEQDLEDFADVVSTGVKSVRTMSGSLSWAARKSGDLLRGKGLTSAPSSQRSLTIPIALISIA